MKSPGAISPNQGIDIAASTDDGWMALLVVVSRTGHRRTGVFPRCDGGGVMSWAC